MKTERNYFTAILVIFVLWGTVFKMPAHVVADPGDHRIYEELLEKYVNNGVVNYHGLKNEEHKLDRYLKMLEQTDTESMSRNSQFAFYINAYNAWTLKLILGGYPGVQSIKELGGFFQSPWKKKICRIDGKVYSLDEVEHHILRPRFKDPRVHFAINCASKGCPPLRSEPYSGDFLDQQLEEATENFVNNPTYNYSKDRTLYLSAIFSWFNDDFNKDAIGFVLKYAKRDLQKKIQTNRDRITVKYLDYDWSLNGQ